MKNAYPQNNVPRIGVLLLAMMNLAIVCTLRGLPIMAEEGLSLVFYFLAAAIIFLIPLSLITAELSTGWPPKGPGGVFIWVNEAFGPRLGFMAIWLQWIQNVTWFPAILTFIGATIAYSFKPELAENKYYMMGVILFVYWGGTLLNFKGLKISGMLSFVCVIIGTIFPALLIIFLGIYWLASGQPSATSLSINDLIPDLSNIRDSVFLSGAVLTIAGIEVSAAHSHEVINPKKTYPRAILLAAIITVIILTLSSLGIAIVVPHKDLSIVYGIMETFKLFFDSHKLGWLVPVMAFFIAAGAIGELSAWIIGPAKGLMSTVEYGYLPKCLQKVNKLYVPTNILIAQGIVATVLTMVFLFMPTVSSSYWILTALTATLYLIMYLLVFASAIRLRYTQPNIKRGYTIPGGKLMMCVIAGIGITGVLLTLFVSFFPPSQIDTGSIYFYEAFLIIGTILMCTIPFIITMFRKPSWNKKEK